MVINYAYEAKTNKIAETFSDKFIAINNQIKTTNMRKDDDIRKHVEAVRLEEQLTSMDIRSAHEWDANMVNNSMGDESDEHQCVPDKSVVCDEANNDVCEARINGYTGEASGDEDKKDNNKNSMLRNGRLSNKDSNRFETLKSKTSISTGKLDNCTEARSSDVSKTKGVKWSKFGLKKELLDALNDLHYAYPSPVQVKAILPILEGRDLLVRSKNGTGKTASYIIPMLNSIDADNPNLQAIILVPIRELALQIAKNVKRMSTYLRIRSMPIIGGTRLEDDIIRIGEGVHVIVGTPGKVLDLLEKKLVKYAKVQVVFDEADKLLDDTFRDSVYKFLSLCPLRQTLLYSATFPVSIKGFVAQFMDSPMLINLMDKLTLENVAQFYTQTKISHKVYCLISLLTTLKIKQCVVFCNSINTVKLLAKKITELGLSCYFMHSQLSQEERNTVFHNFSTGQCKILVSTDIITRGIDVPDTNVIINFDTPTSLESYLHRVGRAGRFGRSGIAISIVCESYKDLILSFGSRLNMEILPISNAKLKKYTK